MKQGGLGVWLARMKREMVGGDLVSIEEGRRVLIRCCLRIEDYEERLVRVRARDGWVSVVGEGLTMRSFRGDSILVEGHIRCVTLDGEGMA